VIKYLELIDMDLVQF